jgi:hypothetical protein
MQKKSKHNCTDGLDFMKGDIKTRDNFLEDN